MAMLLVASKILMEVRDGIKDQGEYQVCFPTK